MGVNVDDSVEGASIHGDGINVAARLEAMADPSGICLSSRVHEDAQGSLLRLGILIFAACSPPNGAPPSRGRHP
jgi:class 3 adenylate cyclase